MINNLDDIQKLNQANMDAAMRMMGDWTKNWQAIAAEMQDYTKRSVEGGTQTFEKLMGCRSAEQVMEVQQTYIKRAYEDYVQQCTKLGGMYAELAKEASKPMERLIASGR